MILSKCLALVFPKLNFYNADMTDHLTPEKRSWNMGRIKAKNTKPEILLRSALHRTGYRFRIHVKDLPGKPDIVLPKYKTVIFVHGCFWHRHKNCKNATMPKTRVDFWQDKFERNVANDEKHKRALEDLGWKVITVWECELKNVEKVLAKVQGALEREYAIPGKEELPVAAEERGEYIATN